MSNLLERTRVAALDRVRVVRRELAAADGPHAPGLELALRELHAIKGETAMAGLRAVSRLIHAFESLLLARRRASPLFLDDAQEALRVLAELLASTPASELDALQDIEDLEAEVLAASHVGSEALVGPLERPSPPVEPSQPQRSGPSKAEERGYLRIESHRIDELSDLVSEMAAELDRLRSSSRAAGALIPGTAGRNLAEDLNALRGRVGMVEERAWALRLGPVAPLFQELAEHLEGVALRLGKSARIEVDAHGVFLERRVLEAVREGLLHLGRNAIDHGIEAPDAREDKPSGGRVVLSAVSEGSEIVLAVEDDGAGLDADAILRRALELGLLSPEQAARLGRDEVLDLIFASGFSQKTEVSELSGRGVGLTAVRRKVEDLGGTVRVVPRAGSGTRFELTLPASVARERVLIVESGGLSWAIPSRWVRMVVRDEAQLMQAKATRMLRTADGLWPARSFSAWLGARKDDEQAAVILQIAGKRVALLVARALSEVELLRCPADPVASAAARVAASGTLPDGSPAFFLRWAEVAREALLQREEKGNESRAVRREHARVLIVDDSPVIRDIVGNVLTGAGLAVTTADDGRSALDLLGQQTFDLVISDVEMPRMNGLELLQNIRQRTEHLPVVMLTTRSTSEHRREAALLGANAYIAKSEFEGETLLDVVGRFLDIAV